MIHFSMILYGEDSGICSYEKFNHLLKPHYDKRYSFAFIILLPRAKFTLKCFCLTNLKII